MFNIPRYYKKPSFQRVMAGIIIGFIISWAVYMYIFGESLEHQGQKIQELKLELEDAKELNSILIEDKERLNNTLKQKLVIQSIKVEVTNEEKYRLSQLTKLQLERSIKQEINHIVHKDIESVSNNLELLKRAIQNKSYPIDNTVIDVQINKIILTTFVEITVEIIGVDIK